MKNKKPRTMIGAVPVWCAHDAIVDCVELKPNPKNPNTHPKSQIELLGKIITKQGWRMPITVSKRSGLIVKGHGRLEAAFRAGVRQAPVDYQEYESEAAEHADMVADNRLAELAAIDKKMLSSLMAELKLSDIDLELSGFSQAELDKHFLAERQGLTDDDDAPGTGKMAKTKPGDLYRLGDHRLLCGDATDAKGLERLLDGTLADMVFTDPPYNVDYEGKTAKKLKIKNDNFENSKEFGKFLKSVLLTMRPFLSGDLYVCMSTREINTLYDAFIETGGHWSDYIVWVKNRFVLGRKHYQQQYEQILYGWFSKTSHYWSGVRNVSNIYSDNIQIDADGTPMIRVEAGGVESNIWDFPNPLKSREHPNMKPVALCRRAIVNSSKRDGIVLDVFGGSGSTLIACEKTYRRCRMMELDPIYCDVIVQRWEDYTGKKAELIK